MSGIGVMVLGADETVVESETRSGESLPDGRDRRFHGGLAVVSSADLGGSDSDGNLVRAIGSPETHRRTSIHDGSGEGNRFFGNTVDVRPDGLCH